jgi:3-hydroxybutyryl-CoA dehydrogenase
MKYICESCNREWDYPIERCIFCKSRVSRFDISHYRVEEITMVAVPSEEHPITPYYVMLLRDGDGSYRFQKTFSRHVVGDVVHVAASHDEGYSIGIIGTGLTGRGIAEVAVRTGNKVILKSRSREALKRAESSLGRNLCKSMSPQEAQNLLGNVVLTLDYEDLSQAQFVIESVVEDLFVKREVCSKDAVLTSNTSSLCISSIAEGLERPERVAGLHFFNPVTKMQLVEIVQGEKTSSQVLLELEALAIRLNKAHVRVQDTPGFIVNRLLFSMINEACRMLDKGIAGVEDIDKAMKLGANYPMGPFELADLIGLDLCLEIIENLMVSADDRQFQPAMALRSLVEKGSYGRKSGKGFYQY